MDTTPLKLSEGETLAERYRIEAVLGEGGMGKVYLATDLLLSDMRVALKILHSELCRDPKHKQRFLREVQLNRMLNHPNVVKIFDVGSFGDGLYLTMEYVEGQSLKQMLAGKKLSPSETIKILKEICKGLDAVHGANVIHRDLKPGNVLLGNDEEVKIADFGVARPGVSELTAHDEVIGCAPYIAPEVWMGKNVTSSADIYALGVIAYEMIAGELPFDGDSPADLMRKHLESKPYPLTEIQPDLPEWISLLVLRMLEKEPSARPESAAEIFEALRQGPTSVINPGKKRESTESSLDEELLAHLREVEAITSAVSEVPVTEIPMLEIKDSKPESTLLEWDREEPRHISPPDNLRSEATTASGKYRVPSRQSKFVVTIGSFNNNALQRSEEFKRGAKGIQNIALLTLLSALIVLFLVTIQVPVISMAMLKFPTLLNAAPEGLCSLLAALFSIVAVASLTSTVVSLLALLSTARRGFSAFFLQRWIYSMSLMLTPIIFLWAWFAVRIFIAYPALTSMPETIASVTEAALVTFVDVSLISPVGTFYKLALQGSHAGYVVASASTLSCVPYYIALALMLFLVIRVLTNRLSETEVPASFSLALIGSIVIFSVILNFSVVDIFGQFNLIATTPNRYKLGNIEFAISNAQVLYASVNYALIVLSSRLLLCTSRR